MKTSLAVLAGFSLLAAPLAVLTAQDPAPRGAPPVATRLELDRLMTGAEREAAGLRELSAAQRQALEEWLARYTAAVSGAARVMEPRPSGMAQRRAMAEPGFAMRRSAAWACYLPVGAPMRASTDGGSTVTLADGTRWQIALPDQPSADVWQRGDFIIIERTSVATSDQGGTYDYELVNAESRWRAAARFAGYERPSRDEGTR
jgi:hypothetical protein